MQAIDIVESLGITDEETRLTADYYERKLTPRTPSGILAQCRGAVSVLQACREKNQKVEARQIAMISCITVEQLLSSLATCQKLLDIKSSDSIAEVCRALGHSSFEPTVTKVFNEFKEKFMATVPEAQKPHTNVERPGFITAVFLYCAARNGIFMKANVVLQRIEIQRTELYNAIGIVSRTLSLPSTPFDKALWKASIKKQPPPLIVKPSSSSSAEPVRTESSSTTESTTSASASTESKPSDESGSAGTPTLSWRETVLQELEARRQQQQQQQQQSSSSSSSTSNGSSYQPKRKKLRQTTLLF